jgi:hypothetical protein
VKTLPRKHPTNRCAALSLGVNPAQRLAWATAGSPSQPSVRARGRCTPRDGDDPR